MTGGDLGGGSESNVMFAFNILSGVASVLACVDSRLTIGYFTMGPMLYWVDIK